MSCCADAIPVRAPEHGVNGRRSGNRKHMASASRGPLAINTIHLGDSRELLPKIAPDSVALSFWSPPYFVGKSYERGVTFDEWQAMLTTVVQHHHAILKPGGFLVVNIADILCFSDPELPRIQAETIGGNRLAITRDEILATMAKHPGANRYEIARILGVSEQTVDRRLKNNNVRGGKHNPQTRVKLVGCFLEDAGHNAGLYLYDRRVWVKDPAWENSRWHTNSFRAIDEFEHLYFFWKPGITKVDRGRLDREEWSEWGSRAVWYIPSVRANNDHEAKFPIELPRRLIRLLTDPDETVLDCFMGSGTTAAAAIEEGRNYIGIEKEADYVKLARKSVAGITRPIRPASSSR